MLPDDEVNHVLVPVKAFARAKARLAPALDPTERSALARTMATRVIRALGDRPVWVVCDDAEVAAWARSQGASVSWQPGRGLNGAVTGATRERFDDGARRVTVVHSDLPLLAVLPPMGTEPDSLVLVPDRHGLGSNVVSTPTPRFRFFYGTASLQRHLDEGRRLGLPIRVLRDVPLSWDVDEPADLAVFETSADPGAP